MSSLTGPGSQWDTATALELPMSIQSDSCAVCASRRPVRANGIPDAATNPFDKSGIAVDREDLARYERP
ncbi:unnamed protein product, partial [Mycena citricolor]